MRVRCAHPLTAEGVVYAVLPAVRHVVEEAQLDFDRRGDSLSGLGRSPIAFNVLCRRASRRSRR